MMEIQSRLEIILLTRVSFYVDKFFMWGFGWFWVPTKKVWEQTTHDINILFFHDDDELVGFDDNQLSMLGLDVKALNDDNQYWNYTPRNRR